MFGVPTMKDMDIDYDSALSLMRRKDHYCTLCQRKPINEHASQPYYELVVMEFEDMAQGILKEKPTAIYPVNPFAAKALKNICTPADENVWVFLPKSAIAYKTQVLLAEE